MIVVVNENYHCYLPCPVASSLASPPGLKRTSTCTEHLTAGICESHKVDVGWNKSMGWFRGTSMVETCWNLIAWLLKFHCVNLCENPVECCPLNDIQYSSNQSPWTLKQRSKVSWKQLISAPSCGFEGWPLGAVYFFCDSHGSNGVL